MSIKSLLPEDYEPEVGNDIPPEQVAYEDEQQMMREQNLWRFTTDAKELLWQVECIINGVRYDALMVGDKPSEREGLAAIATKYDTQIRRLLGYYSSGIATVLIHVPTLYTLDDIKDNYIPF